MPSNDKLDQVSKILGIASELGKLLVIGAAALFMVSAMAVPDWVRDRLTKMQITTIKTPLFDLILANAPKANASTIQAAEALTRLEIEAENLPADKGAEVLKNARAAKRALDEQDRAVTAVAVGAGFQRQLVPKGWVYVGYFPSGSGTVVPGDRIDPAGLSYQGGKLRELVLKRDAAVSSNGDDCTRTDVANVAEAGLNAQARKLVIVRGARDPLHVVQTAECSVRGGGRTVFAEIEVPESRVRFAELASVQR